MESIETQLLNKYNIPTLFPSQWPEEKDISSDSEDEGPAPQQRPLTLQPVRRSKSRFSVLETSGSFARKREGVEKTKDGVENLVQKDEQDPLGTYPSVVQVLRQRGLAVEDDIKLRNRFLLSSTTFSPSLFLSNVHSSASTDSLLSGLDFLSRSIEKKSASLKVLVEANFERFVGAKATIDRVYSEMRADGQEAPEPPPSPSKRPGHSRGPSRSSFSARPRGASATLTPQAIAQANGEKKKNALVKESEYGVHGIKVPLTEVAVKAEEVWGPALGGKDKEDTLKSILSSVEKHRGLFEVGSAIQDAIRRKDHETIVDEYTRARKFAEDARYIVEQADYAKTPLSDSQIHQIIVTARMWADVEHQIETFKRDTWKRLTSTHFSKQEDRTDQTKEQYMELIIIMLELGVEENPIWLWLTSRYEYLKKRLIDSCDRTRVEIEYLRRLLGNQSKPGLKLLSKHLRAVPTNNQITAEPSKLDVPKAIEFWEHMHSSMTALLAVNGGLLGELVEYWDIAQSFIEGRAQKNLPMGFNNQSSVHHKLTPSNVTELEKGVADLANIIREHLLSFFVEPPIDDLTSLYSPLPTSPTPSTPRTPRTPLSAALSPTMGSKFRFDPNNVPPPSPKTGDAWEKYAFWPPHSNALSSSHYLAKSLVLIGTAANELASLRLKEIGATVRLDEALRLLVGNVRERCIQAVCAAWNTDAESLKVLEDWTRDADRKDITTLPTRFFAVQSFLLNNLQKIMYIEASGKTEVDVLIPPSNKLLQMARSQFVTSLYRTLSGMVECAEKGRAALGKDFEIKSDDLTVDEKESDNGGWGRVDASQRSIRLLLTLSNMSSLKTEITPQLVTLFETLFSVSLTDERAKIDNVLLQLDQQLFKSYNQPHAVRIAGTIEQGIFSPSWAPPPEQGKSVAERSPSPYVFTILLSLVLIHTEVSTTSPPLTPRILRALFESTTTSLINTFRDSRLPRVGLAALMQATLDVEFMAQTLASYTTEAASATQTEIYQVLDGKTDNEARERLQQELGRLRGVLKALREGTRVEFSCFRREKRAR